MFSTIGSRVGLVLLSGVFAVACAGAEGAAGAQGSSALMNVAPEPAGLNCPNGGRAMTIGVDVDEDGALDESEVQDTTFVCNGSAGEQGAQGLAGAKGEQGADGTDGADGEDGADGADGRDGKDGAAGANGKDAPVVKLGQFLPSQVVAGMVVECATTNQNATTVECRGMKVNGLDTYLGPKEANALCAGVTGAGYSAASGLGAVPAPWLSLASDGRWTIATAGTTAPMQNLTCFR